ncbi:MAG: DEAD/DEAH box helicase family protein [Polyangiaceae bacterium]|nr:DEAD/DEAH box helicase family protein [Polyangiaceae bacterium]
MPKHPRIQIAEAHLAEASPLPPGAQVRHPHRGVGVVIADNGQTVVVRFPDGIAECEAELLTPELTVLQAVARDVWDDPLATITLGQATAIQSVNHAWGIFSRTRIELLPHQLWVCRQVNRTWPTRWLVADDVGLGKTVEAGLVLLSLQARGAVRRLLVLCPAGLVAQWQERLLGMFNIRVVRYSAEADTPRTDFWGTHDLVVASLQTLRTDHRARHQRLFQAEPWDLLMVDEAHHLNADQDGGPTRAHKLVERLIDERRVKSAVFFTGTPHRGKDYGFFSLLRLLNPSLFDPARPLGEQLPHLKEVMIRNNKQSVTNLNGERLFASPKVGSVTYAYSPEESRFYDLLSSFIITGKAYASSLGAADSRMATLVLIAMQKLASSSVAAIRRAIRGRLSRIRTQKQSVLSLQKKVSELQAEYDENLTTASFEELSQLEEQLAVATAGLQLMENEELRLAQLVEAADAVVEETKIKKMLEILDERFAGRSVLFFTEYKATQSLLMSALIAHFGADCATFINGDDRADEVVDAAGRVHTLRENREDASTRFNSGKVRFLVSTEAGGEGRDLQDQCHCLIHVDLPWNPMRLHQRVGRINRYGQKHAVEVLSLRNPDTVEALIWDRLNEKISRINQAFAHAMDEPEDLLQLVLGMASPALFTDLFSEAPHIERERLSEWFDATTASFGGEHAVKTVQQLIGHCARFDFKSTASEIPKLDLPAVQPFFERALRLNRRQVVKNGDWLSFKTPEGWMSDPLVSPRYEDMTFRRELKAQAGIDRLLGVGHVVVDRALADALASSARAATVQRTHLAEPLILFRIRDRVTRSNAEAQTVVAGVFWDVTEGKPRRVLSDWQALEQLNEICNAPGLSGGGSRAPDDAAEERRSVIVAAQHFIEAEMRTLAPDFKYPFAEPVIALWPTSRTRADGHGESADPGESDAGNRDGGAGKNSSAQTD